MCRSIKPLRVARARAGEEDVRAASLQFVRKVSGFRSPSKANQAAFDRAVAEIAAATSALLDAICSDRLDAEAPVPGPHQPKRQP